MLGLDCLPGIQTARILAKEGIPVIGIARDPQHPFSHTNTCSRIVFSRNSAEDLLKTLELISSNLDHKPVLYPCTDQCVMILSRNREALRDRYMMNLPAPDVLEMLMDKARFFEFATKTGLAVPMTFLLRSRTEAFSASQEIPFPCIMKPAFKTAKWEKYAQGAKVYFLSSPEQFLQTYDRCSGWSDTILVQEWVHGTDSDLYSCNCYFDKCSQPVVTFVARKLRQSPPCLGVSSSGEECRNDVVLNQTVDLFTYVQLRGLGYLEMKRDSRTGQHRIIEPNIGRPTGRSAIAEAGGVPLLYSMYCDLTGLPLPAHRGQSYRNAKWVYFKKDLESSWYYWRRGDLTLGKWLKSLKGCRKDAVLSLRDPLPFVYDCWESIKSCLRRVRLPKRAPHMIAVKCQDRPLP